MSVLAGESYKVLVRFPTFTNHFHGLTTQFDIFLTIEYDPRMIVSRVFMLSYFV